MKPFAAAVFIFVIPALAAPATSPIAIKTLTGSVQPDSYIVVLKSTAVKGVHLKSLTNLANTSDPESYAEVTHDYSDVLHGYAATLRGAALQHVLTSKDVDYIEKNGIVSINHVVAPEVVTDAIQERNLAAGVRRATGGAGVDVYVIDTGIYIEHSEFSGRASWGAIYGGYAQQDGNGHGTFIAGIAVGKTYSFAPAANVIAIKVLSDAGSGTYADVISGVNYASSVTKTSGRPSVANIALGGSISTALDSAVSTAIAGGLHFTAAAGNSGTASPTSPADVQAVNTVGALGLSGNMVSDLIDVWAPGVNIESAWIGNTTATATRSSPDLAAPYVAGILALALGEYGSVSAATLSASLKSHAKVVSNLGGTYLVAQPW